MRQRIRNILIEAKSIDAEKNFQKWTEGCQEVPRDTAFTFSTGKSVYAFVYHGTRSPRKLLSSGRFDTNKLGSTYGSRNDLLGWYFTSDAYEVNDEDYVGKSGEILDFWVKMKNPLVLNSSVTDIIDSMYVEIEDIQFEMRRKGHDGIVYAFPQKLTTGDARAEYIYQAYRANIKQLREFYAKLPEKEKEIINNQNKLFIDHLKEKGSKGIEDLKKEIPDLLSMFDEIGADIEWDFDTPPLDGGTVTTRHFWMIVPPEHDNNIKSAEVNNGEFSLTDRNFTR